MRSGIRGLSKVMSLFVVALSASSLLFGFQNCGTMEAGLNPLYSGDDPLGCIGVNCERDLNSAGFKSSVSGVMLDNRTATSSAAICDNTTCFDVAGFCEAGGYPSSVFYYQWFIGGTAAVGEVRTTSKCDENGRFQVLVKVPFASFNWTQTHRLRLFMKVVDEYGAELMNPTGQAEWSYVVSIRY